MTRIALLIIALPLLFAGCQRESPFLRQGRKATLVQEMREALLASVESEKSAVLAITDEESKTFAEESRKATVEMTLLRDELHGLVAPDGRAGESEKLAAFDTAWSELRDVDERLLALAVANSNLKAAWLAAGDSARAVDSLVDALAGAQSETADAGLLRELSAASVAALRIQAALAPHIASPDDTEMTRLEEQIRVRGQAVEQALASTYDHGPAAAQPHATAAVTAWNEYQRLIADVLRLSRLNTNVRSVDVSLHEKRRVTAVCRDALTALLEQIHSGATPTR